MCGRRRSASGKHCMSVLRAAVILIACTMPAHAADCPRPGALGTSRTLAVDVGQTPRVGLKSFAHPLPLEDHEVFLPFDHGPWPPPTARVLPTLAQECVRATF